MKKMIIAVLTMTSASAFAQMPVPLIDNDEVSSPAHWKAAAPIMQAALECRKIISPSDSAKPFTTSKR